MGSTPAVFEMDHDIFREALDDELGQIVADLLRLSDDEDGTNHGGSPLGHDRKNDRHHQELSDSYIWTILTGPHLRGSHF